MTLTANLMNDNFLDSGNTDDSFPLNKNQSNGNRRLVISPENDRHGLVLSRVRQALNQIGINQTNGHIAPTNDQGPKYEFSVPSTETVTTVSNQLRQSLGDTVDKLLISID